MLAASLALYLVLGACIDGTTSSCTLSGCAIAKRTCDLGVWSPCECWIVSCDDGNPCTTDTAGTNSCGHTYKSAGSACSDGNACTANDACDTAGHCIGSAVNPDDGNPCTADTCNPATGVVHTPVAPGTPCSDGNACTANDACDAAGHCIGSAVNLDDGNPCTADTCNPATGPVHTQVTAGTPCDDRNVCTTGEVCDAAGQCTGTPVASCSTCADGTVPMCSAADAQCAGAMSGVAGSPVGGTIPTAPTEGGSAVDENTGQASYLYPFQLPAARGRYKPTLELRYTSANFANTGAGVGWALPLAYVEFEVPVAPQAATETYRGRYWVSLAGKPQRLLYTAPNSVGWTYRPEVNPTFLEVTNARPGLGLPPWLAVDAEGNRYEFSLSVGSSPTSQRWYLTKVTDVDGNVTEFMYAVEGTAALLQAVSYNSLGPGSYATRVELTWQDLAPYRAQSAGGLVSQQTKVLKTVTVKALQGTAYATIRRYEMGYRRTAEGALLLETTQLFGSTGSLALPPTTFQYQDAGLPGYTLGGGVAFTVPGTLGSSAWMDMDGDGRPDRVWNVATGVADLPYRLAWARNITPTGGDALVFDTTVGEIPNSEGWGVNPKLTEGTTTWDVTAAVRDMNGDGLPDIVRTSAAGAPCALEVKLAFRTANAVAFAAPRCYDVTNVWPAGSRIVLENDRVRLQDVDGDGILDYLIGYTESSVPWQAFLGYQSGGTSGFGAGFSVSGSEWVRIPEGLDWNSDGFLDAGSPAPSGNPLTWSLLFGEGTALSSAVPWPWQRVDTTGALVDIGFFTAPVLDVPSSWYSCSSGYELSVFADHRSSYAYVDLNGDGRPDVVVKTAAGAWSGSCSTVPCPLLIFWNTGGGFLAGPLIQTANDLYPSAAYWTSSKSGVVCEKDCYLICQSGGERLYRGWDEAFVDMNADGIADHVTSASGWVFFKGSVGTSGNRVMLHGVTTSAGATYTVEYSPSSSFGASPRDAAPWVVTAASVSGPRMASNTTRYWYEGPTSAPVWDQPTAWEPRGFATSWSQDEVTRIVKTTSWVTHSHPFAGSPSSVEWGTPTGGNLPSGAPAGETFRRIAYAYSARRLGDTTCVDSGTGEPPPATYPLVPVTTLAVNIEYLDGGQDLYSTRGKSCTDVDDSGNTLHVKVDPDLRLAGDEYYEHAFFDPAATCKHCAVETRKSSDAAGNAWIEQAFLRYDSLAGTTGFSLPQGQAGKGHLNYVSRWVWDGATSWYEIDTYTAYNTEGTVASKTRGGVTESYTYDPQQLWVTKTTAADTATTLVSETAYDHRGLPTQTRGPYLLGSGDVPTLVHLYDDLGREVGVGRSMDAAKLYGTIRRTKHDDTVPRSVRLYSFAAPLDTDVNGPISVAPDVGLTVSYFDGLGRTVQVRERLGTGTGTPDARSHISQNLTGYKVLRAVQIDGAGRTTASLEPVHVAGEAYEDFAALAAAGRRGSMTWFDARGRRRCATTGVYSALVADAGACQSSFGDDSSHRLATAYRYRGVVSGTRYYAAVEAVPAARAAIKGTEAVYDAAGRLAWTTDAYGNRVSYQYDLLSRPIAITRLGYGNVAAQTTTVDYDSLGRKVREYDPNWSPGASPSRTYRYDAQSRPIRAQLAPKDVGGSLVRPELVYEYASLGRLTRVTANEPNYVAGQGVQFTSRVIISQTYDRPYDASKRYVGGRVATVVSPLTTIALGYDQNGALVVRDQWFAGVGGAFTSSTSRGNDGRVLSTTFASTDSGGNRLYSNPVTFAGWYDSAGRAARIDLGTTGIWEAMAQDGYGAYDPLGRAKQVRSNGGTVDTFRNYSVSTAQLVSHVARANAQQMVYGVDQVLHFGAKLSCLRDSGTGTDYGYGYDANGRLERARAIPPAAPPALAQSYDEQYSFTDPSWAASATVGNLERVTRSAGGVATTDDYTYADDRVTSISRGTAMVASYAHDESGRVTQETTSTGWRTTGFDVEGHLKSVRRSSGLDEDLEYDPWGGLMFRKVGGKVTYYVGNLATVTGEVTPGCTGYGCQATNVKVAVHALLGGTRIATVRAPVAGSAADPAGDVLYYHRDRLGSVVATTWTGGVVGARYRYLPYGQLDRVEGDEALYGSDLGFTGGLKLTGALLHLRARVYDTELKRFLQPDEAEIERYTYAGGDPVNLIDPNGTRPRDYNSGDSGADWVTVIIDGMVTAWPASGLDFLLRVSMKPEERWIYEKFGQQAYANYVDRQYEEWSTNAKRSDTDSQQQPETSRVTESSGKYAEIERAVAEVFSEAPIAVAWNFAAEYGTTGAGLTANMTAIEEDVDAVYQELTSTDATVTFTTNGQHSQSPLSLHYSGNAVDLRVWGMTEQQKQQAVERLRERLGPNYDVINEGNHIHIEYDPI